MSFIRLRRKIERTYPVLNILPLIILQDVLEEFGVGFGIESYDDRHPGDQLTRRYRRSVPRSAKVLSPSLLTSLWNTSGAVLKRISF